MQNIVSFKAPKFKPMPGELTPAVINGATLPVKVEAAKRAIAACCDLSELLTWKDKLAALAAAAKMARMPEMARDVNRVHKEAIFRMGEILLQYSGEWVRPAAGSSGISKRTAAARDVGIPKSEANCAVRLAAAPSVVKTRILKEDRIPARALAMARFTKPTVKPSVPRHSNAAGVFLNGIDEYGRKHGFGGLTNLAAGARGLDLSLIPAMNLKEKQRARKLVIEMQEILDEIDRRLGPDTSVKS